MSTEMSTVTPRGATAHTKKKRREVAIVVVVVVVAVAVLTHCLTTSGYRTEAPEQSK